MIGNGPNLVDGIPVEVIRKRIRRINLRVARDGTVRLSIPERGATLALGEAFLKSKWEWVLRVRAAVVERARRASAPPGPDEIAALQTLLSELNGLWSARLGEAGFTWRMRRMTSLWGSCNWRRRRIVYNSALARHPRELVEYVVVHELTHFKVHNHGPEFRARMDASLPDWRLRRRMLNGRGGDGVDGHGPEAGARPGC